MPCCRPRGLTFTTRAALLALVLCAVVLTLAYPAREYLAQHRQISDLTTQVANDKATLAGLKAAGTRATDPAYVKEQARERLHMIMPGDVVYQLPPPLPVKVGKQVAGSVHTPELPGTQHPALVQPALPQHRRVRQVSLPDPPPPLAQQTRDIVEEQLGRPPRAIRQIAHTCTCGPRRRHRIRPPAARRNPVPDAVLPDVSAGVARDRAP